MHHKPISKAKSLQLNKGIYVFNIYYQNFFILSKNYSKIKVFKAEYIQLNIKLIHLNHNLYHKYQEVLVDPILLIPLNVYFKYKLGILHPKKCNEKELIYKEDICI